MATVPETPAVDAAPNGDADAPELPETWLWDEDGDACAGTFVRFDKGATREYGKKLILVLRVGGVERSVWLLQTALYSRIRDEIADRPERKLEAGERVLIHRLPETTTEDGKRTYRPYRAYFPDKPELDVAREFDLDKPAAKTQAAADGSDVDDDIPF